VISIPLKSLNPSIEKANRAPDLQYIQIFVEDVDFFNEIVDNLANLSQKLIIPRDDSL